MKLTVIVRALFITIFIICSLIVLSYFLCNLFLLPKIVAPRVSEELSKQLNRKFTIQTISITPRGIIHVKEPVLYSEDGKNQFAACKNLIVKCQYAAVFKSWRTNRNILDIPLEIQANNIALKQAPVAINAQGLINLLIKLDLKNRENIAFEGDIQLSEMNIENVPILGSIKDIAGTVNFENNSVSSQDLQGTINGETAALDFKLNDFKNPTLQMHAKLSPLELALACSLEKGSLTIKNFDAVYNQIQLNMQGILSDISSNPVLDASLDCLMNLEDLQGLPLEIKPLIEKASLKGLIRANARVQGQVKTPSLLNGNIRLQSAKVSFFNRSLENIGLKAKIEKGKILLSSLEAASAGNKINATAEMDTSNKNLPFAGRLNLTDADLASLIKEFSPGLNHKIRGDLSSEIIIKGNASDLNKISLSGTANLKNFVFDEYALAQPATCQFDILLNNLNNIAFNQLEINDSVSSLAVKGDIKNFKAPDCDLTVDMKTSLDKLSGYNIPGLSKEHKLSGSPSLNLKLKGNVREPLKLHIPFLVKSGKIGFGRFSMDSLAAKGTFKDMQLDISSLLAKLYNGEISLSSSINLNEFKNPEFKFAAEVSGFDLEDFFIQTKLLPQNVKGILSLNLTGSGKGINVQDLNVNAQADAQLENASIEEAAIEQVKAELDLDYKNKNLLINNMLLSYKGMQLAAKAAIDYLFPAPKIKANASSSLDIEQLYQLPFNLKEKFGQLNPKGSLNVQANLESESLDLSTMSLRALASSDEISVKNIAMRNVKINADLSNNVVTLSAGANAYSGDISFNAKAVLPVDKLTYSGKAAIKDVDIGALISESKIIAQPHKGILSLNGDFQGEGTDLNSLKSVFSAELNQAQISGLELLRSIGKLLRLDFLSNFQVNQAQGNFNVQNSKVHTEDTTLSGPQADVLISGDIGFDQSLNLITRLMLSPESAQTTNKQVLDEFFTYENERFFTELEIQGTLANPKPNLSKFIREKIQKQVKKAIKKEVFKALDGLFR